ncbi:unnamed protein product [Leptosia nina]|uniref:Uncharacterized protein n=1 Tax=Leptosia nina TaxID=320188 RepID=A0AAV1JSE9_9NEOP
MADGSSEDRAGPKKINELTFPAIDPSRGDIKKCSEPTPDGRVQLSFYTELDKSESCEKSETLGVAAARGEATLSQKTSGSGDDGDDRKKRCFDRYDSSESSDRCAILFTGLVIEMLRSQCSSDRRLLRCCRCHGHLSDALGLFWLNARNGP